MAKKGAGKVLAPWWKPTPAAGLLAACLLLPALPDAYHWHRESGLAAAKQYEAAAKEASQVRLLWPWLAMVMHGQMLRIPDAELGHALPLLRLIAPSDNFAHLRLEGVLRPVDPGAMVLENIQLSPLFEPSPTPDDDRFEAAPAGGESNPEGQVMNLRRRDGSGWADLGQGFEGALGSSFDVEGGSLWVARPESHALERWDLARGKSVSIALDGPPGLLAVAPDDPERVAYTVSAGKDGGDRLWLYDHGTRTPLYPPADKPPAPPMGVAWSDDGHTLLATWEQDGTHSVWLRPDGAVGLEATAEEAAAERETAWSGAEGVTGLALDEGAWVWRAGEPRAKRLEDVKGLWTLDPSGQAVASLDEGKLSIRTLQDARRVSFALPHYPKDFEPDADSFRWARNQNGDTLSLDGALADEPEFPRTIAIWLSRKK